MKTGKRKKLLLSLGILALVVIALIFILPKFLNLDRYKGFIIAEIEQAVDGKVSLGHISWGISSGIWLETDRFSITGASILPVDLDFPYVYAKISIIPLLKKKIEVLELRLKAPKARVRLEPPSHGSALSRKKRPPEGIKFDHKWLAGLRLLGATPLALASETDDHVTWGKRLPVEISVESLFIHHGQITLVDTLTLPTQELERVFTDVEIEATGIQPQETVTFHISLRDESPTGLGPFEVKGTFRGLTGTFTVEKPKLKMKGVFPTLHAEAFKPYLGNDFLDHRLGGHASLEVNYDGDFGDCFHLAGLVDLTAITFTDPSLWERPLPGAETKIHFQGEVDPQGITVDGIKLGLGNLSLSVRAQIMHWREKLVIKNAAMSAGLALGELPPLIPWKLLGDNAKILRPIFESGGSLIVEECALSEMDPALLYSEPAQLLSRLQMTARVSDISAPPSPNIPKIENVTGMIQIAEGVAHISGLKARILSSDLPEISARISKILEKPRLQAQMQGALILAESLSEEDKKILLKAGIVHLSGTADLDLDFEMDVAKPKDFNLQGKMALQDFHIETTYTPASLQKINGDLVFTPKAMEVTAFSANVLTPQKNASRSEGFNLKVDGKVEDWHRQPVFLLHHLSTSPVPLPSLVPIIPWEKLGDGAEPVRKTLLAGGSVTINEISWQRINLQQPPKTIKEFFSQIKAKLDVSNMTVKPSPVIPAIEGIGGRVMIDEGNLTATDMIGRMGPFYFPTVEARATGLGGQIQAAVTLKGPMSVKGTQDVAIEELLRKYGLNRFSGRAEIDMRLQYDQRKPHLWTAEGSLELKKIDAEAYPEAIRLEDLQGSVYLKREKTLELIVDKLTANIDKAPIRLDAMLTRGGTPQMLVQGKVYAENLDLAHVNAFLPRGEELKLTGNVDVDVDIRFPFENPVQTRLAGTLKTHGLGFYLKALNTTVKEGMTDLAFVENKVLFKHMSVNINDQKLGLKGQWKGFGDPEFFLQIDSPHLSVDRLIPAKDKGKEPLESSDEGDGPGGDQAPQQHQEKKRELPLWAHRVQGDIQVEIAQGVYKKKPFHDLKLEAHYERGVVKPYNLGFQLAKGQVQTQGCLDLRDLNKIEFVFDPTITALSLEAVTPLFGFEKPPIYGPISVMGRLSGDTLAPEKLLTGLAGTINLEVGAGQLPEIKHAGKFLASILSILNVTGIFSGALSDTLRDEGIPFNAIHSAISVDRGKLHVEHLLFVSAALNASFQGTIDLMSHEVDMKAALAPLGILDKVMGIVPILGKQAKKLTQIYLSIEGSLEDPKVNKTMAKGVGDVIISTITAPMTFIDKVSSSPKKDEDLSKNMGEENVPSFGCGGAESPGEQTLNERKGQDE